MKKSKIVENKSWRRETLHGVLTSPLSQNRGMATVDIEGEGDSILMLMHKWAGEVGWSGVVSSDRKRMFFRKKG